METRYPMPDRSNFTPNQLRHDPQMPEGDLGATTGALEDGRPYRAEGWCSEGATFVTLFFSERDLEGAEPQRLLGLVRPVLAEQRVPDHWRKLGADGVHVIADASGNRVYSLTFVVGEPDL